MSNPLPQKRKVVQCDNHAVIVKKKLYKFYKEKYFYDVTLIASVDNVKMEAHRLVLSASSDYFMAMFRGSLKESTADEVKLENMDGSTLKLLLDFIYTASVELRKDTVENVLRAADLYQLKTLIEVCCDFMGEELDVGNCLGVAYFAEQHGYTELYQKSITFACNHFDSVCTEKEFVKLNEEQLKKFLSNEDIRVVSRDNLPNCLVAWVEHDKENREKLMFSLMSHVRSMNLTKSSPGNPLGLASTKPRKTRNLVFAYDIELMDDFTVQVYNRELNKWTYKVWPNPAIKRSQYGATVVNNTLFIAGGIINGIPTAHVECLDAKTMKWSTMNSMEYSRYWPALTVVGDSLHVVGGSASSDSNWCVESCALALDAKWREASARGIGTGPVKVAALNGVLYVALRDEVNIKCFDHRGQIWMHVPRKNSQVVNFGMTGLGGYLYVVGGDYKSAQKSGCVERYDPAKNIWVQVQPMNHSRSHVNCAALNNRLIACGGIDSSGRDVQTVEEYNTETSTWVTLASLLPHKFKMLPAPLLTI